MLAAATAPAQESAPMGLLRGDLIRWTGTPRGGEFTFRATENHIYFCSYDAKTYFERDNQRITMAGAETGDRLEVVSDHKQGSEVCYARTVHILNVPRNQGVQGLRPRPRASSLPAESFARRGDLTFSGVVLRVTRDILTLRSRSGEHTVIHLRPDTRYLTQGQMADLGSLRANTLVFIRASRNLDDQVEAYQVIWGEILRPQE